jgi:hypothetical protein
LIQSTFQKTQPLMHKWVPDFVDQGEPKRPRLSSGVSKSDDSSLSNEVDQIKSLRAHRQLSGLLSHAELPAALSLPRSSNGDKGEVVANYGATSNVGDLSRWEFNTSIGHALTELETLKLSRLYTGFYNLGDRVDVSLSNSKSLAPATTEDRRVRNSWQKIMKSRTDNDNLNENDQKIALKVLKTLEKMNRYDNIFNIEATRGQKKAAFIKLKNDLNKLCDQSLICVSIPWPDQMVYLTIENRAIDDNHNSLQAVLHAEQLSAPTDQDNVILSLSRVTTKNHRLGDGLVQGRLFNEAVDFLKELQGCLEKKAPVAWHKQLHSAWAAFASNTNMTGDESYLSLGVVKYSGDAYPLDAVLNYIVRKSRAAEIAKKDTSISSSQASAWPSVPATMGAKINPKLINLAFDLTLRDHPWRLALQNALTRALSEFSPSDFKEIHPKIVAKLVAFDQVDLLKKMAEGGLNLQHRLMGETYAHLSVRTGSIEVTNWFLSEADPTKFSMTLNESASLRALMEGLLR